MENRLIIDQATNTLVAYKHIMYGERLDYLVIPHQYNGMQIDRIGPHCFDHLIINYLCIEEGVKYLEDCALENAYVINVKLPRGLMIGERCFADSELEEILLPRDLHIIKKETFLNCKELQAIYAFFGVSTISYNAFKGCKNLKEAHFRILKTIRDGAFEGCRNLRTLELGTQVNKLGSNLFKDCDSLETLEIHGSFDKFEAETFSGAWNLNHLKIWTRADSLYFPPEGFKDTNLQEMTLTGDFDPLAIRSSFPEDITFRGCANTKQYNKLAYAFDYLPIK